MYHRKFAHAITTHSFASFSFLINFANYVCTRHLLLLAMNFLLSKPPQSNWHHHIVSHHSFNVGIEFAYPANVTVYCNYIKIKLFVGKPSCSVDYSLSPNCQEVNQDSITSSHINIIVMVKGRDVSIASLIVVPRVSVIYAKSCQLYGMVC